MKNTNRNVIEKIKLIVYARDEGKCVICGSTRLERSPHHAWFGFEANRKHNRNDPDQLVTICIYCHNRIHNDMMEHGKYLRELCKNYLIEYYK